VIGYASQPPQLPPQATAISLPPPMPLPLDGTMSDGAACEFDGLMLRLATVDPARLQPVIDALRRAQFVIHRINVFRPSLEDLFFEAVTYPATGRRYAPGAVIGGQGGGR